MGWDILCWALPALLGLLLVSAGIEDARIREIANWKNAAITLLAPLWWLAIGLTPAAMGLQLAGALAAFGLFCIAFHYGQMGGGDVKLIGALALWLPISPLIGALVIMSLIGGIITLLILAEHKLRKAKGQVEIPYGVAIAIAGLVSLHEPLINQFT